jgi:hypothetical protein
MLQRAYIKPQCLVATVIFLLALLICVHTQDATEEETRFFTACSSGDVELIAAELSKNKGGCEMTPKYYNKCRMMYDSRYRVVSFPLKFQSITTLTLTP